MSGRSRALPVTRRTPSEHWLYYVTSPIDLSAAVLSPFHELSQALEDVVRSDIPSLGMVVGVIAEVPERVRQAPRVLSHSRRLRQPPST